MKFKRAINILPIIATTIATPRAQRNPSVEPKLRPICLRPFLMVTSANTKPAKNMYKGTHFLACCNGFSVSNISFCALLKIINAKTPEISGVIIQLPTIPPTEPHATVSTPTPTAEKPTMAPTIECVVDTGQPIQEAISNQVPAENNAAIIPNTNNSGVSI